MGKHGRHQWSERSQRRARDGASEDATRDATARSGQDGQKELGSRIGAGFVGYACISSLDLFFVRDDDQGAQSLKIGCSAKKDAALTQRIGRDFDLEPWSEQRRLFDGKSRHHRLSRAIYEHAQKPASHDPDVDAKVRRGVFVLDGNLRG